MEQLLKTAQDLVLALKEKKAEAEAILARVTAREASLSSKESAFADRLKARDIQEDADTLYKAAKAARDGANAKALQNLEAEAKILTAEATIKDRLAQANADANEIIQKAGDVKGDRERLEAEKLSYRATILEEIKSKLGA